MHIHANTNLEDIQRALANKYLSTDLINQYQCMRSQNQVMQTIRQIMQKKGPLNLSNTSHNLTIENLANIEASSISQVNYSNNDDSLIKSKFTEEFQQSIVNAALKEVKTKCSEDTYETVKQYIQNNKIKEVELFEKRLQKMKQDKQEFASQLIILKLEKSNTEKQLEKCRKIVNGVEEQKNNIKKRVDYILRKQNQIYKLQTSFAFKEKINLQLKKRYERLRDITLANQQKVREIFQNLDELWNLICNKMESVDCPSRCWKKDLMKKAKEQLIQERKLLKEQSNHIEKQYEIMNVVSNQFKKIFQEPEKFHQGQSASANLNKTQQSDSSQSVNFSNNTKKVIEKEQKILKQQERSETQSEVKEPKFIDKKIEEIQVKKQTKKQAKVEIKSQPKTQTKVQVKIQAKVQVQTQKNTETQTKKEDIKLTEQNSPQEKQTQK